MNFVLIALSFEKHTRLYRAFSASCAKPSGSFSYKAVTNKHTMKFTAGSYGYTREQLCKY